jgi:hypothetical protein
VPVWAYGGAKGKAKREKSPAPEVMDAGEFARVRLGIEPDATQMELLQSGAPRVMLNCSRQWGKSTVAALMATHHAVTRPDAMVIVASASKRQSNELLKKIKAYLKKVDMFVGGDGVNVPSAVLKNGSRIVGLPGRDDTTRGFSATLLVIDEAARVSDAMYKSLRPMVATTGGVIWLMSTPNGKQGFFYEEWEYRQADWTRVSVPATECPRIGNEFLEEERRSLGPEWFAQEYMGEFVSRGTEAFDRELVEAMLDERVEGLGL